MNCNGCGVTATGGSNETPHTILSCNTCKSSYCYQCLNISPENVLKLSKENLAALKCPSCTNVTRRRNTADTPVGARPLPKGSPMNVSFQSKTGNKSPSTSQSTKKSEDNLKILEDMSKLLDNKLAPSSSFMMNLRSSLKEDMEQIISSKITSAVQKLKAEFTETTDFIVAEQVDIKGKLQEKNNMIKQLEADLSKSNTEVAKMSTRLAILEKISRDSNVEIQEVPESKSENLLAILQSLCKVIDTPLVETDVRAYRRVAKINAASNRPRNIVVTLASPRHRDTLISAVLRYNKLHANDKLNSTSIGIAGEARRIYVSEHLSADTKQLHAAARKTAKELNYKYVWVRFGRIYLRKDHSDAILVKNIETLAKLH
ncbi:unnamed protein product [Plutella xylostella]|uniref:(diamondback moth) hypothetical protein n=1 Tax=Plutella xylostella TaxID=51655 RepID=A0A8S4DVC7_PLUXY|nr:unnamed protein product [Plutella xylostella]